MKRDKNGDWEKKRKSHYSIPVGKTVLMIYCGKCTEPEYFGDALKKIQQSKKEESMGLTEFIYKEKILPVDPKGMANKVESIIQSFDCPFDEVYVVFDKDSFKDDNFDNAVIKINELNNCGRYPDTTFIPLWSNQCIELWFVLHFEYLQAKLDREDYFAKMKEYLHLKHKYKKHTPGIYEKVSKTKRSIQFAINNSEKLLKSHEDETSFSDKFPATNVVEFFKKYKDSL